MCGPLRVPAVLLLFLFLPAVLPVLPDPVVDLPLPLPLPQAHALSAPVIGRVAIVASADRRLRRPGMCASRGF
ncbi:hypothetical protein ACFVT1_09985 [Streptomyces sp. NPDC057963]|uniref:hypothetical protein n=1 Tax=Streptomyces sp. NPDC057963 TaxID=3346290 RepID=UPI0036EFF005